MLAFDEMVLLEEKPQKLETEADKIQGLIKYCRKWLDIQKLDIGVLEEDLRKLKIQRQIMKSDRVVVLLSEYEALLVNINRIVDLLAAKKQEAARLTKQGNQAQNDLKSVKAEMEVVRKQLSKFGQLVPFSR